MELHSSEGKRRQGKKDQRPRSNSGPTLTNGCLQNLDHSALCDLNHIDTSWSAFNYYKAQLSQRHIHAHPEVYTVHTPIRNYLHYCHELIPIHKHLYMHNSGYTVLLLQGEVCRPSKGYLLLFQWTMALLCYFKLTIICD